MLTIISNRLIEPKKIENERTLFLKEEIYKRDVMRSYKIVTIMLAKGIDYNE